MGNSFFLVSLITTTGEAGIPQREASKNADWKGGPFFPVFGRILIPPDLPNCQRPIPIVMNAADEVRPYKRQSLVIAILSKS